MDIVELIKREHAKISSLFDRLADTSDGAVKTRERLFSQLKDALDVHGKVVQDHIYPLLRKSEETRELVPDLKERNELKRQLGEIDRGAKDDDAFLQKLKELRGAAEQHLRTEARQIFPAIKRAVGGAEAEELAGRIAAEIRDGLDEAKQRGEPAGGIAGEASRTAAIVSLGAQRAAEEVGETTQQMAKEAAAGSRRVADAARQANAVAPDALQEMQRVWIDWFDRTIETGTRASQNLLRCTSLPQVAEVQREFWTESLKGWVESSTRLLQATQRASASAARAGGRSKAA
jgi:hemerythrin-like domain-containing protein